MVPFNHMLFPWGINMTLHTCKSTLTFINMWKTKRGFNTKETNGVSTCSKWGLQDFKKKGRWGTPSGFLVWSRAQVAVRSRDYSDQGFIRMWGFSQISSWLPHLNNMPSVPRIGSITIHHDPYRYKVFTEAECINERMFVPWSDSVLC